MTKTKVAALYVDTARGPYPKIENVECYGFATRDGAQLDWTAKTSDARSYDGPWPVVAHPPCGPWGRFWWNYKGGEGSQLCGLRAVEQVRKHGGILEHPSNSSLWDACGMPAPGEGHDVDGGYTIEVRQCDWGHKAAKPTWLYVVGVSAFPPLPEPKNPSHVMVRLLRNNCEKPEVPKKERHITPKSFAEWLVAAARTVAT